MSTAVTTSPLTSVTGNGNRTVMLQVLHSQVNTLSSSGSAVRPLLISTTRSIATARVSISRFIFKSTYYFLFNVVISTVFI